MRKQIGSAGRVLGFLEERTSIDQARMGFVVSSGHHWRLFEDCNEQGIEPRRRYSGELIVRIPIQLRERLAMIAEVQGKSLNTLAQEALQRSVAALRNGYHAPRVDQSPSRSCPRLRLLASSSGASLAAI
jgi:hypothetical protein